VAEIVLRRIEQAERVSELFLELVEVARMEYFNPPATLNETGQVMTTTRIPAIVARLKTAVAILAARAIRLCGGFAMSNRPERGPGTSPDGRRGRRRARQGDRMELPVRGALRGSRLRRLGRGYSPRSLGPRLSGERG
jgi:hypothetical protein